MATGKIGKRTVDALDSAGRAEAFLWDEDLRGFGLKVTSSGTKTFVYQYRLGGREARTRRWTIGRYGAPWTPTSARAEAVRLGLLVARGIDPGEQEHERRRESVDLAFDQYAGRFIASCSGAGWKAMVERTIRLHAAPVLGRKPLPKIARHHITDVLDHIPFEQQAARRNAFAVLRRLFRWAVSRGDLNRSPCEGIETPPAVRARDRVLSDTEIYQIWHASLQSGKLFGPIIRLLITTGQRRNEVSGLRWEELNRETKVWTLPGERSKNGEANVVPLNDLAILVIDSFCGSTTWPKFGLAFATSGGKVFAMHAKGKARLDKELSRLGAIPVPAWRIHDLRRTLATGFQRLGVRFEVTEAVLNHLSGSRAGVAGVYQRHTWAEEKRDALDTWSDHLRHLTTMNAQTSN